MDPAPSPEPTTEAAPPSVLWRPEAAPAAEPAFAPACFADLNLDRVVNAIVAGRQAYDLRPWFHAPLADVEDVAYRHEVFLDLESPQLRGALAGFGAAMERLRVSRKRATAIRNPLQVQRLRLDAATAYVEAVIGLADALGRHRPASRGLLGVAAYLEGLVRAPAFRALDDEVREVQAELATVTYRLTILEDRVHVRRAEAQTDYGEAVERTFATFRRHPAPIRPTDADDRTDLNTVEAAILRRVAQLHPGPFRALEAFAARHEDPVDPVVERFDRELQFYLAYLAYLARFEGSSLGFCLPEVRRDDKRIYAEGAFDLALAGTLDPDAGDPVVNDLRLDGTERVLVVTGANQGGKSTFARMVGQLHYLAALGVPVPARSARLLLCDTVLTHFDREESVGRLLGKLQEELTRLRDLWDRATDRSLVVMNEAFSSTSKEDALELGRATLEQLLERDALVVYVTFVDELSSFDPRVVSMTALVDPDDPSRRTFRVVRRPADGQAHALALARAYGLTYDSLRGRLGAS